MVINKSYQIGVNKTITPIFLTLEKPNGFKIFSCEVNRSGLKTTDFYHSLHIQTLINRWIKKQEAANVMVQVDQDQNRLKH